MGWKRPSSPTRDNTQNDLLMTLSTGAISSGHRSSCAGISTSFSQWQTEFRRYKKVSSSDLDPIFSSTFLKKVAWTIERAPCNKSVPPLPQNKIGNYPSHYTRGGRRRTGSDIWNGDYSNSQILWQPLLFELPMGLTHICLYGCLCVHGTAKKLDGMFKLADKQTSQQTDMNET